MAKGEFEEATIFKRLLTRDRGIRSSGRSELKDCGQHLTWPGFAKGKLPACIKHAL